jgi:hypothetical protein
MSAALTMDDADQLRDLADRSERAAGTALRAQQAEADQMLAGWLEDLSNRLGDAADLARRIAGYLERGEGNR